jgi:hypothetical protein
LWHLPWLAGSFVLLCVTTVALTPFAGPGGTGPLAVMLLGALVLAHLLAAALGLFLTRRSWRRVVTVLSVAAIPTVLLAASQAREAWYLSHQAVNDRFRDNVMDPIPSSVSDLHFIDFRESFSDCLMFRFDISPADLDRLIRTKGFKQIKTTEFRQPNDLFTHPEYLPLAEPATYYIINDIRGGYPDVGIGEGYTLKVSADRSHVIFRRESAAYYRYKYWESGNDQKMARQFLESTGTTKTTSAN